MALRLTGQLVAVVVLVPGLLVVAACPAQVTAARHRAIASRTAAPALAGPTRTLSPRPRHPRRNAAAVFLYVLVLVGFGGLYLFLRDRRGRG